MANQSKERSENKPTAPQPAAPDKANQPDPNAESVHGIPPGVSFDTDEGRRAQGMLPDIGKGRPNDHQEEGEEDEKDDKDLQGREKPRSS